MPQHTKMMSLGVATGALTGFGADMVSAIRAFGEASAVAAGQTAKAVDAMMVIVSTLI